MKLEIEPQKLTEGFLTHYIMGPYGVDNHELARYFYENGTRTRSGRAWRPETIEEVTGISKRYYLQPLGEVPKPLPETVPNFALQVVNEGLARKRWPPERIDILAVCHSYPFGINVSHLVADEIGATNAETLDVNAACSSPVFFLHFLHRLRVEKANLVVACVEHYSNKMRPNDFHRAIFSDGASVLITELGKELKIRESAFQEIPSSAIRMPIDYDQIRADSLYLQIPQSDQYFEMDGESMKDAIKRSDLKSMLVGLAPVNGERVHLVSHQGSVKTNKMLADVADEIYDEIELYLDLSSHSLARMGNPAAASTFLELDFKSRTNQFRKGDVIKLVGIGARVGIGVIDLEVLEPPSN